MRFFPNLFDRTKQNPQTSYRHHVAHHGPNQKYKIIHQALVIPNLPAPIRYLNFSSLIGKPNLPIFQNTSLTKQQAANTASVIASISPHMTGHSNHYAVLEECFFSEQSFYYSDREKIDGKLPHIHLHRHDPELSFDMDIQSTHQISYFKRMQLGLYEHWSLLVRCRGQLSYQNQIYEINHLGSYEYARTVKLPYFPISFLVYQVINLENGCQLLLLQLRDRFNHILQSRLYLRDINLDHSQCFDQNVQFFIYRVFPCVKTPHGKSMYLLREFEWRSQNVDGAQISILGTCRGDYKFGLGEGYVGSFDYEIYINNQDEKGEGGYIQYIDCRGLKYQELDETERKENNLFNFDLISCKK